MAKSRNIEMQASPEPEGAVREYGLEAAQLIWAIVKRGGRSLQILVRRTLIRIPKGVYNGVDVKDLNRRMRNINWNKDYYSPAAVARSQNNPRLQRDIMRVNRIFRDLKKLSDSDHHMGEELRWKLQRKHWMSTSMAPRTGNTLEAVQQPVALQPVTTGTPLDQNRSQRPEQAADLAQGNHQSRQQNETRRRRLAFRGGQLSTPAQNTLRRHRKGLHL